MPAQERMESKEEWVSAAEAIQLLKPVVKAAYVAQKTICARAHNGLIRSRAERFMVDNRVADGHETVRGTVFHVGRFDEWSVVVAECGEGNVYAAATDKSFPRRGRLVRGRCRWRQGCLHRRRLGFQ